MSKISTLGTTLFPWAVTKSGTPPSAIKWSVHTSRYKIHIHTLDGLEVAQLLPHCLVFKTKVKQAVSSKAHYAVSFFRVFPRTLSEPLLAIWQQILADLPSNEQSTVANFDTALKAFIATHAMDEDRHNLTQQLRLPKKPRMLAVQQFYYRLCELNGYVHWLPGNEPALSEEQLKQALYNGMPSVWRDRFVDSGASLGKSRIADLCHYFRKQESKATQKQLENECSQRHSSAKKKSSTLTPHKKTHHAKHARKSSKDKGVPNASEPRPFHPGHTWGECFRNADNPDHRGAGSKNRSESRKSNGHHKKSSQSKANSFAVEAIEPIDNNAMEVDRCIQHLVGKQRY